MLGAPSPQTSTYAGEVPRGAVGCRNILPADVGQWKAVLGCSGHGGNNPKQSEQCLHDRGLWDGAPALCAGVCQEHGEMVMMVMVTWVCCLGLGVLANDSPNHAVRRAVPSRSLETAQRD